LPERKQIVRQLLATNLRLQCAMEADNGLHSN
jgi:hypothetical protein